MLRRSPRFYTVVKLEQLQHSTSNSDKGEWGGKGEKLPKTVKIFLPFTYFCSMTEPCLRAAGSSVLFT